MKYVCSVCDYVYDPEVGDPDNGIEPGTAFEDLPDDWVCPECGEFISASPLSVDDDDDDSDDLNEDDDFESDSRAELLA